MFVFLYLPDFMHLQIYKELYKEKDKGRAEKDKRYHKYEGFRSLGVGAPKRNSILKSYNRKIKEAECKEVLLSSRKLYLHGIEEAVLAANFLLKKRIDCVNHSFLEEISDHLCSWSTVDDFCIGVLQPLLLKNPRKTISLLRKWNKSRNMWKRRSSVVVFTRSIGESGEFTDEALSLCERLIWDKEDMVQKGVGWCLKDIMRGEKEKVLSYIENLKERGVSSTITLYALRDTKKKGILSK